MSILKRYKNSLIIPFQFLLLIQLIRCDFVENPGEVSDPDPVVFTKDINDNEAAKYTS